MTPLDGVSAAMHLTLGLILLWILIFGLAREYRTDALRDRLFAVRDKLFDYAQQGGVPFDHPAYVKLRLLINSLIRFAHRLTFTRFALGVFFRIWKKEECELRPLLEWQDAVSTLPEESQKAIRIIHSEMLVLVVRHLITGSPIMMGILFLFSIWAVVNGAAKRILEAFAGSLPGLDALQVQAVVADAAERQAVGLPSEEAFAHH